MAVRKILGTAALGLLLITTVLVGCSDDGDKSTNPGLALNNCVSCHLDADQLVATASPEDEPGHGTPGEG